MESSNDSTIILNQMAIYKTHHPESSNLRITSYNSDTKILRVLYKSGYLYLFYDVQKYIYDLIASGSPRGGKIAWKVLPNYSYRQINRNYSIDLSSLSFTEEELALMKEILL